MVTSNKSFLLADNGGGRSGIDRRQFSYNIHIPERRSTKERRSGEDRRIGEDRRMRINSLVALERRSGQERRTAFRERQKLKTANS